jgi:hypothetical protein
VATSASLARQQLVARLHEQMLDVAHLRAALDVQMNRISHLYTAGELTPPVRLPPLLARVVRRPDQTERRLSSRPWIR